MTVTEKFSRKRISGVGWVNPLTHDFMLENSTYLKLYADDVQLTLGVDYTVADVGNPAGYVVVITTPGSWSPDWWVLSVETPIDQQVDVSLGGSFGTRFETAIDNMARRMQVMADGVRRAPKLAKDSDPAVEYTIMAPEAGTVIGWNAAGTNFENKVIALLGSVEVVDEDDMASNSATKVPSQQSVKAYVDSRVLDEDDMASDSATRPPSQQSVKAFAAALHQRNHFDGYTPVYNLDSAMVEGGGTDLSVQHIFDMGDITLPSGANKQHAVMRFTGIARNDDDFETSGAKFISFAMESHNADAYGVIGSVTLKTGAKGVKAIYGRASIESTDPDMGGDNGGVGLVGGVTIGAGVNATTAWALQLTVDGAGDLPAVQGTRFISLGTNELSKTVGYGVYSHTTLSYGVAFIRAFNGGAGPFLMWQQPNAGGAGIHADLFRVEKLGHARAISATDAAPAWSFVDDTNTGMYNPVADTLGFSTGGSERVRIDSSGRFNVGMTNVAGMNLEILNHAAVVRATANATGAIMNLYKTRNTTPGSWTVVQDNDALGELLFFGDDGDSFVNGAAIKARIDGTPANNSIPTELEFWVANDASSPSAKMTLKKDGKLNLATGGAVQINGVQVLAAPKTGWAAATGTATRTTFVTGSVTLPQLAERVKALIDDLYTTAGHGLIAA